MRSFILTPQSQPQKILRYELTADTPQDLYEKNWSCVRSTYGLDTLGNGTYTGESEVASGSSLYNYALNPRLIDTDENGQANAVWPDLAFEDASLVGTPVYTNSNFIQRVTYTGVSGDSSDSMAAYGDKVGYYSQDDPVSISVKGTASGSGLTVRSVVFDQVWTVIAEIYWTLDGVERTYSATGTIPAGVTSLIFYWYLIEGIDEYDTIDLQISEIKASKESTVTPYFDGTSPMCEWSGTADASTSLKSLSITTDTGYAESIPYRYRDESASLTLVSIDGPGSIETAPDTASDDWITAEEGTELSRYVQSDENTTITVQVGPSLSRAYYSETPILAHHYPSWTKIYTDTDSHGQKFLNVISPLVEDVKKKANSYPQRSFINYIPTGIRSHAWFVLLPDTSRPIDVIGDDEVLGCAENLQEFLESDEDDYVYYQDGDKLFVSSLFTTLTIDGDEYATEKIHIWNQFDEIGEYQDLARLPEESNTNFKARILDTWVNPPGAALTNLTNAIERESGASVENIWELRDDALPWEWGENLFAYSGDFSNTSYWGGYELTYSANATTDPLGGNTGWKIKCSATPGVHYVYVVTTITDSAGWSTTNNTDYVLSIHAKADDYDSIRFVVVSGGYTYECFFNLDTGVITGEQSAVEDFDVTSMVDKGNGWWRCLAQFNSGTASVKPKMYIYPSDGLDSSITGDTTDGIFIWEPQLCRLEAEIGNHHHTDEVPFLSGVYPYEPSDEHREIAKWTREHGAVGYDYFKWGGTLWSLYQHPKYMAELPYFLDETTASKEEGIGFGDDLLPERYSREYDTSYLVKVRAHGFTTQEEPVHPPITVSGNIVPSGTKDIYENEFSGWIHIDMLTTIGSPAEEYTLNIPVEIPRDEENSENTNYFHYLLPSLDPSNTIVCTLKSNTDETDTVELEIGDIDTYTLEDGKWNFATQAIVDNSPADILELYFHTGEATKDNPWVVITDYPQWAEAKRGDTPSADSSGWTGDPTYFTITCNENFSYSPTSLPIPMLMDYSYGVGTVTYDLEVDSVLPDDVDSGDYTIAFSTGGVQKVGYFSSTDTIDLSSTHSINTTEYLPQADDTTLSFSGTVGNDMPVWLDTIEIDNFALPSDFVNGYYEAIIEQGDVIVRVPREIKRTYAINWCINPGCELDSDEDGEVDGFTTGGSTTDPVTWSQGPALGDNGARSQRAQYTGVPGDSTESLNGYWTCASSGVEGDVFRGSCLMAGTVTGGCTGRLSLYDQSWNLLATAGSLPIISTPTRYSVSGTLGAGDTGCFLVIQVDAIDNGDEIDWMFDDVLVEKSATLNTYFDGSLPGASWTGAENGSKSVLTVPDTNRTTYDYSGSATDQIVIELAPDYYLQWNPTVQPGTVYLDDKEYFLHWDAQTEVVGNSETDYVLDYPIAPGTIISLDQNLTEIHSTDSNGVPTLTVTQTINGNTTKYLPIWYNNATSISVNGITKELLSDNVVHVCDLVDDFARGDGALGTSADNHVWTGTGTAVPVIASQEMVLPSVGAGYGYVDLADTCSGMSVKVYWAADTDPGAVIALLASNNSTNRLLDMVHLVVSMTGWALSIRKDGGSFNEIGSGTYTQLSTNTDYTVSMAIDGDTVTIYLPTGDIETVTHCDVGEVNGRYIAFELLTYTADEHEPRFKEVLASTGDTDEDTEYTVEYEVTNSFCVDYQWYVEEDNEYRPKLYFQTATSGDLSVTYTPYNEGPYLIDTGIPTNPLYTSKNKDFLYYNTQVDSPTKLELISCSPKFYRNEVATLVARVTDANGNGVEGITVGFDGTGLTIPDADTDENGIAITTFTPDDDVGITKDTDVDIDNYPSFVHDRIYLKPYSPSGTVNVRGIEAILSYVQTGTNINSLSFNQATIEEGTLEGFERRANGTFQVSAAEKSSGNYSLKVIAPDTGDGFQTPARNVALNGTSTHTFSAYVKGTVGEDVKIGQRWWHLTTQAFISEDVSSPQTMTGSWQRISISAAAPSAAGWASQFIENAEGAAMEFFVDDMMYERSASPSTWGWRDEIVLTPVIYTDSSGSAGSFVARGPEFALPRYVRSEWVEVPLDPGTQLTAGDYWIGFMVGGTTDIVQYRSENGGSSEYASSTYTNGPPATWPSHTDEAVTYRFRAVENDTVTITASHDFYYPNLLLYSEEFEETPWNNSALVTRVDNQIANPVDGNTTAALVAETTATGSHYLENLGTTLYQGGLYYWSIFLKAKDTFEGATPTLIIWDDTWTVVMSAIFDLEAGTFSSGIGYEQGMIDYGNGWYRCWVSAVAPSDCTYGQYLVFPGGDHTGETDHGIYVYGAQLDEDYLKPYFKTEGTHYETQDDSLAFEFVIADLSSPEGLYLTSQTFEVCTVGQGLQQNIKVLLLSSEGRPITSTGTYSIVCTDPGEDDSDAISTDEQGIATLSWTPASVGRYSVTFTFSDKVVETGFQILERV